MATTTTMAAVKAALKTLIAARPGLSGVQVVYGDVGDKIRNESIRLGATTTGDQESPAFRSGTQRRRESYTLEVIIEVVGTGSVETIEARAVEISSEVEAITASNPKLDDVPNLLFVFVEGMDMETTELGGTGPRSVIELSIRCEGDLL